MAMMQKVRIGQLLVDKKLISESQLEAALEEQKRVGRKLGATLVELGIVREDDMLQALAEHMGLPFVDLKHYRFDPEIVRILPEMHARRYRTIVLNENEDGGLLVGMADPTDIFTTDKLHALLQQNLSFAIVREAELTKTIDLVYRRQDEISSLAEELGEELAQSDFDVDSLLQTADIGDAPVVKLIHSVFTDAVQVNASDIHIEPDETLLRVRQRVDGVLSEQTIPEKRIAPALTTRIKLMAGLDIAEKRLPQDGRFSIRVAETSLDVRVSTMPAQYGESIVMRLLNQSAGFLQLAELGMPPVIRGRFEKLIHLPHGMVLVTGPTGSGKTTTLYAALSLLNSPETKIITVEDPVEYRLPRITQVQVNEKIHLDFAGVLRSALRQDPDILLVGEMRDKETAQIGVRAAMTGHLVLSTLHTNDAVTTAPRMLDMGVEGYLIAAALRAILSQRLVRRICDSCITSYEPDEQESGWLSSMLGEKAESVRLKHGIGCPHCNNTGYRGRIGVYELLEQSREMIDALRINDANAFARAAEENTKFINIPHNVLAYASNGITTVSEAQRIIGEREEESLRPPEAEATT